MANEDLKVKFDEVNEIFGHFFEHIEKWSKNSVAWERFFGVRFCGIRIHAWNYNIFSQILSTLTRLVKLDGRTKRKKTY